MNLLPILQANKGTVSSALGKELAENVLKGNLEILEEALDLVCYKIRDEKEKNVRAGAAKILEKVAEKRPELVAQKLERVISALDVPEPQTRWMLMQTFGFCAKLNPVLVHSALPFARKYLKENAGVCLSGAVHLYLGRLGAVSPMYATLVLPILDDASKTASENEIDWILEAYLKIIPNIDSTYRPVIEMAATLHKNSRKKSTQERSKKILKKLDSGKPS
jgi:hypothetical protein